MVNLCMQPQGLHQQFSHAFVTYQDASNVLKIKTASDPQIEAKTGYRPIEVFVLGCQRGSQALRHARWLLTSQKNSPLVVSYRAGLDHFAQNPVRPGDVIWIDDNQFASEDTLSARLELNGFEDRLSAVRQAYPDAQPVILRRRPPAALMRYVQVPPASEQIPLPAAQHGYLVYHPSLSDDAASVYACSVIPIIPDDEAPSSENASPVYASPVYDGQPVLLLTSLSEPQSRKWRVSAVRQVALDKVEVMAFRLDGNARAIIDAPSAEEPEATPLSRSLRGCLSMQRR